MSAAGALTDEQRAVLTRPVAPLIVTAAAGSGKTRVLVERFLTAVLEEGIAPERLLTITFTVRAAAALRERIAARLRERGVPDQRRRLRGAFIGTFHGFCAALLREQAFEGALQPGFSVLDEGRAALLRRRAYREALSELVDGASAAQLPLLGAFAPDQLQQAVLGIYDQLRSRGQRSPRLPDAGALGGGRDADPEAQQACALLGRLLALFDQRFQAAKRAAGLLDYDDLELEALALLEGQAELRRRWRERFALIMVDEFQDVNARQLALLGALEDHNLLTVGDEQQSIYGFRHAEVEIFRARSAALRAQGGELALRTSFRSHPELIETLNALFAGRLGERHVPMAPGRSAAEGDQEQARDPCLELLLVDGALSALPWPEGVEPRRGVTRTRLLEAQLLAARISELLSQGGLEAAQIAILMRSRTGMGVYRQALAARAIPVALGAASLWASGPATTLLCHLRAALNEEEELALSAALVSPLCGLSAAALLALSALRARRGCSLEQALALAARAERPPGAGPQAPAGRVLDEPERERLARYLELLSAARARLPYEGIAATLQSAGALLPESEQDAVGALVASARSFERAEGPRVRSFLEYAALSAELPNRADAPAAERQEGVRLLTIHAAKGLEFEVVCLAELGAAPPFRRPLLLVDGERIGVRVPALAGADERAALDYEALLEERRGREQEESERLLYVACTRARERLILSGCASFARWPAEREGGAHLHWLAPALLGDLAGHLEGAADLQGALVAAGIAGPVRVQLLGRAAAQALEREGGLGAEQPPAPARAHAEAAAAAPPLPAPPTLGDLLARRELISYSSLAKLQRCPLRFYAEDILRLPELCAPGRHRGDPSAREESSAPEPAGRALGTLLHELLAMPGRDRPGALSAEEVAALGRSLHGAAPTAARCREIAELARVALGGAPAQRARRAGASHELPFLFVLDADLPPIGGAFDLYAEEREGALVIDYKTDRLAAGQTPEDAASGRYGLQRLIYALGALRGGAAAVEVIHWFLRAADQPAVARFERAQQGQLEAQLRERLRSACARPLAPSARPNRVLCAGCPARGGLCSWDLEATMRAPQAAL